MKSFNCVITRQWAWIFFIQIQIYRISSLSPLWDSVTTNIHQEYDVQEDDDILTVRVNMGEYTSTDLVVGEDIRTDSRLILTCIAHHGPAEWIYSGDGNPNFVTNTTTENLSTSGQLLSMDDMNGAKRYIAMLTLGQLGMTTKDTGRYNCMTASPETEMKYQTLSAYYHVYVPAKQKLFIRKSETIYYDLSKSVARIPCGVSNPRASVTLQKFVKGDLEFVPNAGMLYHPISGYYPKKDIKGSYVCTAAFNNTFDSVHFDLTPAIQNNPKSSKRPSKKPTRYTRPEDLEWLMYQSVTTRRPKPNPISTAITTSPLKSQSTTKKQNASSYIPFHLRYTTTTYAPFQTFQNVWTIQTTTGSPNSKYKLRTTVKTNPFNPSNYPSELFTKTKTTKRPNTGESESNDLPFPEELISYRPIFTHLKNTSPPKSIINQSNYQIFNSKRPAPPIIIEERATIRSSVRNTRTTPRRYRPYVMTTTQMPIVIPESIICSQFSCGINAVCFAHMVYNRTLNTLNAEPGCRCLPNQMGNPYSECYPPKVMVDPNLLLFNLSAFGRSPLLQLEEPIYSNSESESGSALDSGSADEENHDGKTTSVDIIDM